MKKIILIPIVIFFAAATVQARVNETKREKRIERKALRKLDASSVSYDSKQQFFADFGNVPDVQWRRSANFDEATFTKDHQRMTAYYDSESNLVGTTSSKSFADLPASAQKEIRTKYRDYTLGPITFFDDDETNDSDMVLWGLQFNGQDNYFVELTKGTAKIILQVDPEGNVYFFTQL